MLPLSPTLPRPPMHLTQPMSAAVDGEHCGSQHGVHRRHCSAGIPVDSGSDAVAQPDHGLPCLPGSGH